MPFFLVLLAEPQSHKRPAQVTKLWERALKKTVGFDYGEERPERALRKRLRNVYAGLISEAALTSRQQAKFLTWCLSLAKRQVKTIVGEQRLKGRPVDIGTVMTKQRR